MKRRSIAPPARDKDSVNCDVCHKVMNSWSSTENPTYTLKRCSDDPQTPWGPNQLAKSIIDIATGEKPDRDPSRAHIPLRRSPVAK